MRLPAASVELDADQRSHRASEPSDRWLLLVWLVLVAVIPVGLVQLGTYLADRPHHHPEFYGDYRGGYARGSELRAAGDLSPDCETGLSGTYASPTTWPAITAKGIYVAGCRRGAKAKSIGDYVQRVDFLLNND